MIVKLETIRSCYQPVTQDRPHFCKEGDTFTVEVEGTEGWLKFFNATVVETGEPLGTIKEPSKDLLPTDVGAGHQPSVEKIVERFTVDDMVARLKTSGLYGANKRWKPEVLAKHIIKRQLHNT